MFLSRIKFFKKIRNRLKRHRSSYELEPDEDVKCERNIFKNKNKCKSDDDESDSSKMIESQETSQVEMEKPTTSTSSNNDNVPKKTQRQFPSLSRIPRIESETEPLEKEKLLKILKNRMMSVCFSDETKKDEHKNHDEEADCTSPPKNDTDKRLSRNISEKTITSIHDEKTPEKEYASRTWIPKSVSKMLSDKNSSNTTEKKRAKSPSSIFEFKLPKWATFSKKSEEENVDNAKTAKIENENPMPSTSKYNELSRSSEELERSVTVTLKRASLTDSEDMEKTPKTLCRWFVSDEENPVDINADLESLKMTKTLSCEPLGTTFTSEKQPFPFFKGKETKYAKPKSKLQSSTTNKGKNKLEKPSSNLNIDDVQNYDLRKAKSDVGDYRVAIDPKKKSPREKMKFFSKQKSKDKTPVVTRKNSLKLSNLKGLWTKNSKEKVFVNSQLKAISAEALQSNVNHMDREFLMSSLQVFLAVSPSTTKFQLRSRSLNNLDCLTSKASRFNDTSTSESLLPFGKVFNTGRSFSLPDLTKECLQYIPAPSSKHSAFVRRYNKLRHTFSQGAQEEFFKLQLPSNFEFWKLPNTKRLRSKKVLNSFIFIPAVGNTSLRSTLENTLGKNINLNNYIIQLEESNAIVPLEYTLIRQLAGKTAHLIEKKTKKWKPTIKSTYQGTKTGSKMKFFSRSAEERPRASAAPSTSESRQGFSKIFSPLFRYKTDPSKMECLVEKLDNMTKTGVPPLPNFTPVQLSQNAEETLPQLAEAAIENYLDASSLYDIVTIGHARAAKSHGVNRRELNEKELNRQRVILEMLATEASYILHLKTAVNLFYATAHALQQEGLMMDIDLNKLFCNITEILNANLWYWAYSLYPVMEDALVNNGRFNTQLLFEGVLSFHDVFRPYETFVFDQKNASNYSRRMMETSGLYTAYLTWCESHKECNRLKLSDILIKPMQRLTKYTLLFKQIASLTDYEPEKTTCRKMLNIIKSYVANVNLCINYREQSDITNEAINSIEGYDVLVDLKDEEILPKLRQHLDLNLRGPMPGCDPRHKRILILQGDLRMKDAMDSRMEIRAFLMTDMLLLCIQSKKKRPEDEVTYRVIRQKFMVDKLLMYPSYQYKDGKEEIVALHFVYLDDTGTAITYFTLTELNGHNLQNNPTLKLWESAINEAKMTLELAREYHQNPNKCHFDTDTESLSDTDTEKRDNFHQEKSMTSVERAAHSRIITMIHGASMYLEETCENANVGIASTSNRNVWKNSMRGRSRDSSRASRLSSLQQSYSGSYDINESGPSHARKIGSADTSIDRHTISMSSDEWTPSVNQGVDTFDVDSKTQGMFRPRSPGQRLSIRPPVIQTGQNTLSVQPAEPKTLGQSMPDLNSSETHLGPSIPVLNVPHESGRSIYLRAGSPAGALCQDTRGISYPPPRAALKRGVAISSGYKNPLVKSKHISQPGPSNVQKFDRSPRPVQHLPLPTEENTSEVLETINIQLRENFLAPPLLSPMDSASSTSVDTIKTPSENS